VAKLACQAIHSAVTRAEAAAAEHLVRMLNSARQSAAEVES
jgi:hypothetical protein